MSDTDTTTARYVDVNGISLWVETHGTGRPLILLHGGLMSGESFAPVLPALTGHRQVITVDLQGHGRTADVDRPLTLEAMADDVAALIDHLGLERPDLVGYSLGGGVALQVATRHPASVGRLVLTSVFVRSDAVDPVIRAQQVQVSGAAAESMVGTPMHELYQRVAPRPEDFPRLLDKIGAWIAEDLDLTEAVRGLRTPTLIMAADADMAPVAHFAEVFALLDGGLRDGGWDGSGRPAGGHALAILPGTTHHDITASPLFAASVLAFLDATG
ncbi:alpha/beta fold hydrolase [Pseudonocardia alni]|uniref:alpha/beta fold hydrolase n=1 Tax=Pseudonocardia alni TaxID=33907 RepID=UPI00280BF159|nr:alpha/beta fold hydrolase [Pseudonocardia alni]